MTGDRDRAWASWSSVMRSSSGPVSISWCGIPTLPAIATAVPGWSPVTISTRIPARTQALIADGTSARVTRMRPEQKEAIGVVDMLFVPVGGMATIDGGAAAELVEQLAPSWVVPMHRTPAISFLETADAFVAAVKGEVVALDRSAFDTDAVRPEGGRIIVVPTPPR
jgi:hypothetical protein